MMDMKADLLKQFINFLIKKMSGAITPGGAVKSEIILKQELAEELHKPIISKLEKRKVHSSFIDNILGCLSCRYAINK